MSSNDKQQTGVSRILYDPYIKGNLELEETYVNQLDIGEKLYKLRNALGLSHKELAEKAGCSEQRVIQIENADWDDADTEAIRHALAQITKLQQARFSMIADRYRAVNMRVVECEQRGDIERQIQGKKLANEWSDASEKCLRNLPEEIGCLDDHLAVDWVERVQSYLAEETQSRSAIPGNSAS